MEGGHWDMSEHDTHTYTHSYTGVMVPQRFSLNPTLLCSDIFASAVKRSPIERVNR